MRKYKVIFHDNKAVSASKVGLEQVQQLKFTRKSGRKFIEWFVVSGWNENDAILFADKVMKDDLGALFRLN